MSLPIHADQHDHLRQQSGTGLWLLWFAGFAVALYSLDFPGTYDIKIWQGWARDGLNAGIIGGFALSHEYPPLTMTWLTSSAAIGQWLNTGLFMAIKASLLVWLLVSCATLGYWTRSHRLTLVFFAAMLLDTVCLGYIDIYVAPWFLLAFWCLQRQNLTGFAIAFLLSTLTKWQPLIIAPFLALYLLRVYVPKGATGRYTIHPALLRAIGAGGVMLLGFAWLFGMREFADSLSLALDNEYLSGNALNYNWLLGHALNSDYPTIFGGLVNGENTAITTVDTNLFLLSKILFLIIFGYVLFCFARADNQLYTLVHYCLLGYFVYYTFAIGAHENHLFIAVFLSIILLALDSKSIALPAYILLSHNVNLLVFYGIDGTPLSSRVLAGVDTSLVFAGINVIACLLFIGMTARNAPGRQ